jgi:hypothetical protein
MKNKFVVWLLVHIIIPLLKDFLKEVLRNILKMMFRLYSDLVSKWKKSEIDRATTPEAAEVVREKYESRQADLDEMMGKVLESVDQVLDDACNQALLDHRLRIDDSSKGITKQLT